MTLRNIAIMTIAALAATGYIDDVSAQLSEPKNVPRIFYIQSYGLGCNKEYREKLGHLASSSMYMTDEEIAINIEKVVIDGVAIGACSEFYEGEQVYTVAIDSSIGFIEIRKSDSDPSTYKGYWIPAENVKPYPPSP